MVSAQVTEVRLRWEGSERFSGTAGGLEVVIDGSSGSSGDSACAPTAPRPASVGLRALTGRRRGSPP
ncbi:MAG TPA: hypothetical protein VMV46_06155 [Thermoanaerobaculia bacterium]|nr:hypothetical protein [Thermoanaerobaculia bacterium]